MPILPKRALGAALLLLAAGAAHAQYVWVGPNGTRQYSDRPPPPGTPTSKIIKSPGRAAPETAALEVIGEAVPANVHPKAPEAKGPPTLAQREAAYRERGKEREELESKQRQAAEAKRRQAEHCNSARDAQAQLGSGIRIAKIGADGQKTYMTDEERAARSDSVNRALANCRQAGG